MEEKYKGLIDKIVYGLVADNSIDAADAEAYKFGLEMTILKTLHYISYIAIALFMGKVLEFIIIFIVFYIFRRNTGGFHAKTRIGCYLFSCTVVFLSLSVANLSFDWRGMALASFLDLVILLLLSPVRHSNRKLDVEEVICFRRRLKVISLVFIMIYAVTTYIGKIYLVKLYTIGLTMAALLAVLGKIPRNGDGRR